jgi:HSP20 family protein
VIAFDNKILVVIELPGVKKKDINLQSTETILIVSVTTQQHRYFKKIQLPDKVNTKSVISTYNNGVLEVIFHKLKDSNSEGESIEIH